MTPRDLKVLIEKYLRGECNEEESAFVQRWFDNIPVAEETIHPSYGEQMLAKIKADNNISAGDKTRKYPYLKIAASLFLAAIASAAFYLLTAKKSASELTSMTNSAAESGLIGKLESVSNDTSVPKKISLEDGSQITLQPGSELSFPTTFASSERVVTLNGEAFFDIQKDASRPFYVYAKEVVTKVLGTSFNIKALDTEKEIRVVVKTGKVSVYTKNDLKQKQAHAIILTPNQQAVYNRESIHVVKEIVDKPEVILDKPTLFQMEYDGAPVTMIFEVMKENYGVDIQYDTERLKDCVLTTKMAEEGLFERIQVICKAIGATYSVEDAVIKIEGSSCN